MNFQSGGPLTNTVGGDMIEGNKVIDMLQQEDNGISDADLEHLKPYIEELLVEKQAEKPNEPNMEDLIMQLAKAGIGKLSKVLVKIMLT